MLGLLLGVSCRRMALEFVIVKYTHAQKGAGLVMNLLAFVLENDGRGWFFPRSKGGIGDNVYPLHTGSESDHRHLRRLPGPADGGPTAASESLPRRHDRSRVPLCWSGCAAGGKLRNTAQRRPRPQRQCIQLLYYDRARRPLQGSGRFHDAWDAGLVPLDPGAWFLHADGHSVEKN